MKLNEIGEFNLIQRLSAMANQHNSNTKQNGIVRGIGDDSAAWQNQSSMTLATTDCLVQGVHFNSGDVPWYDLGCKAMAVNISDIAAMGGRARFALITLGLPQSCTVENIEELYAGLLDTSQNYGVSIIGGDLSSCDTLFINIALMGQSEKQVMTRDGAQVGDQIALTGFTGLASAWLREEKHDKITEEAKNTLKQAFWRPQPRLLEGIKLLDAGVCAAIDISDGLTADLEHICKASKVSAVVNIKHVPIHPILNEYFNGQALDMALGGGEDYELIFTAKPGVMSHVINTLQIPCYVIGEIIDNPQSKVFLMNPDGTQYFPSSKGWNHFGQ